MKFREQTQRGLKGAGRERILNLMAGRMLVLLLEREEGMGKTDGLVAGWSTGSFFKLKYS